MLKSFKISETTALWVRHVIEVDQERDAAHTAGREGQISAETSRVAVYVIPTNEELLIARDTVRVVSGAPQRF